MYTTVDTSVPFSQLTNEVSQKRNCDDLINSLVERIERERQVQENVGVRHDERQATSGCGEESCVLAQVEKRHRRG